MSKAHLPTIKNSIVSGSITPGHDPTHVLSLLDLLTILFERKGLILSVAALAAGLAFMITLLLPRRYTATVTLRPPQQRQLSDSGESGSRADSKGGASASLGSRFDSGTSNRLLVALLTSRTVEDSMIRRFDLGKEYHTHTLSEARKKFERHFTVDGDTLSRIVYISVEDRDAQRAVELANGNVDECRLFSQRLFADEAMHRRLFFEQQLEAVRRNLNDAENAMKRTQQRTGLIQPDAQARSMVGSAATIDAQIAAREVAIRGMQTYAAGENAELAQATQELDAMRAQLHRSAAVSDGVTVPAGLFPVASTEYARKLHDVKFNEAMLFLIGYQLELARIDEAKQGSFIQMVDSPAVPDRRSFPKTGLIVTESILAGLLAGIYLAFASAGLKYLKSKQETRVKFLYLKRISSWREHPLKNGTPYDFGR